MGKEKTKDKGDETIDPLLEPPPETPERKILIQLAMEFNKVIEDPQIGKEYAKKGQQILDSQVVEKPTEE